MARPLWPSVSRVSGARGGGLGTCSPAHIGLQLDKVPPGAVQQRMKHHLEGSLAGGKRAVRKEASRAPKP